MSKNIIKSADSDFYLAHIQMCTLTDTRHLHVLYFHCFLIRIHAEIPEKLMSTNTPLYLKCLKKKKKKKGGDPSLSTRSRKVFGNFMVSWGRDSSSITSFLEILSVYFCVILLTNNYERTRAENTNWMRSPGVMKLQRIDTRLCCSPSLWRMS